MRTCLVGWMLTIALAIPAALADDASTTAAPESTDERVDQLVQQLASDDWQERQRAQQSLIQLGEGAVGRLQGLIGQTDDPEVRAAIETVLSEVSLHAMIGQTLVTLDLTNVPAEQAFTALMQQAGARVSVVPQNLWRQRPVNVTIQAREQPFWEVLRELGQKTGITLRDQRSTAEMVLTPGDVDELMGPTVHSGAFMIIASSAERRAMVDYSGRREPRHHLILTLHAYAEPKLRIFGRAHDAVLEDVLDEAGNSLIDEDRSQVTAIGPDGSQIFSLGVRLAPPPLSSERIALLRGSFQVAAQVRNETLEVDQIASASNLTRTVGHHQVLISTLRKAEDEYEIRLAVFRSDSDDTYWDRAIDAREIRLFDAKERQLTPGTTIVRVDQRTEHRLTVKLTGKNAGLGPPERLRWTLPVEIREMSVPFEFRDLPLPR